ncbi:MAG: hypothetical protein HGB12_11970 [Bacteroidetes bacterium]|nr:hypothetical protein [Bacteroidota bacterium]
MKEKIETIVVDFAKKIYDFKFDLLFALNVYKNDGTTLLGPLVGPYGSVASGCNGTWGFWNPTGGLTVLSASDCAEILYRSVIFYYSTTDCTGTTVYLGNGGYVTDGTLFLYSTPSNNTGGTSINSHRENGVCTNFHESWGYLCYPQTASSTQTYFSTICSSTAAGPCKVH